MDQAGSGSLFMDTLGLGGEDGSENVVSYELIPLGQGGDALDVLREEALSVVLPFLEGYIWQRQGFRLYSSADQLPPWQRSTKQKGVEPLRGVLWGEVAFGDNVDDEWFIVSLLQRVTARMHQIMARVWDNDGEFLLIEAAYSLPRWLKPETSTNRVFLYKGHLHVVPPPSTQHPSLPGRPTLSESIEILQSGVISTEASPEVQSAIGAKVSEIPEGAHKLMHRARVRVPAKCAAVLAAMPEAVSNAVETFFSRDMEDMKAAARQHYFPPQEMATVICRFNRCLYAQLQGQTWDPPKKYPMPPQDSPAFKAASTGAKLVAGMEMFLSRGLSSRRRAATPPAAGAGGEEASSVCSKSSEGWRGFHARLASLNYFKGEMEGSQEYKRLEKQAMQYYTRMQPSESERSTAEVVQRLARILQEPISASEVEAACGDVAEDDDSWLAASAEELQRELAKREAELVAYKAKNSGEPSDDQVELEKLTSRMSEFVRHMSSMEGAEVPAALDRSEEATLDPLQFLRKLEEVLGVDAPHMAGAAVADNGDSSSEGSSFFSDDEHDSEDDSSDADRDWDDAARGMGGFVRAQDWDARTATDSDDDSSEGSAREGGRGFMRAYDEELEDQLRHTTIAESFDRVAGSKSEDAYSGSRLPEEDGLAPVDLDMNLVSSLLESYASQEGLPGPASNLAGMLGVKLPK